MANLDVNFSKMRRWKGGHNALITVSDFLKKALDISSHVITYGQESSPDTSISLCCHTYLIWGSPEPVWWLPRLQFLAAQNSNIMQAGKVTYAALFQQKEHMEVTWCNINIFLYLDLLSPGRSILLRK